MFQFAAFASSDLWIQSGISLRRGFPIRISRDQSFIASSPALFAGLHVLRRLWSPRHPPDALSRLILSFQRPKSPKQQACLCKDHIAPFDIAMQPRYNQIPKIAFYRRKDITLRFFRSLYIWLLHFFKDRDIWMTRLKCLNKHFCLKKLICWNNR